MPVRLEESTWKPLGDVLVAPIYNHWDGVAFEATMRLYIPGTGEVTLDKSIVRSGEEVVSSTFTVVGTDDGPLGVAAVETRVPASGLTAETYVLTLHGVDLETLDLLSSVEIYESASEFDFQGTLAPSADGVVAISVGDNNSNPAYRSEDRQALMTHGVDVTPGGRGMIWSRAESIRNASYGYVVIPVPTPTAVRGDWCWGYEGVDIATGETRWTAGPDMPGGTCNIENVLTASANQAPGIVRVSYRNAGDLTATGFDTATGSQVFGDREYDLADLSARLGYGNRWPSSEPEDIVDLDTGAVVWSMSSAEADQLGLQLTAIHDGLVYAKTTDGFPVFDVLTGEVLSDTGGMAYPIGDAGEYTLLSDGTLAPNWSFTP